MKRKKAFSVTERKVQEQNNLEKFKFQHRVMHQDKTKVYPYKAVTLPFYLYLELREVSELIGDKNLSMTLSKILTRELKKIKNNI